MKLSVAPPPPPPPPSVKSVNAPTLMFLLLSVGAPNDRQIEDGDISLFDMGAEYFCYGSDVTCSFPVSSTGKFTARQKAVYEGVLNAQRRVIRMAAPGVSWLECHKAAEAEVIKALVGLGIVVPGDYSIDHLVDIRLGAIFMPHGMGHLIGEWCLQY